jgi:hypothetical protein
MLIFALLAAIVGLLFVFLSLDLSLLLSLTFAVGLTLIVHGVSVLAANGKLMTREKASTISRKI